jgi:hypothetical protein
VTWSAGSGKTTFLSQLSLDLAEQNFCTLWNFGNSKSKAIEKAFASVL